MSGNTDNLRAIHEADRRSKERDVAIAKCAAFTADYWQEATARGLPAYLVDRLTMDFQRSYLNALYAESYRFLCDAEGDDL